MAKNCVIKRENRRIVSVTTPSGQRSALFDKLASIPLVDNRDQAASIFKNVYTPKFTKLFGDWQSTSPVNEQAYNKIKSQVKNLPKNIQDSILLKSSKMDNPIMVNAVTSQDFTAIDGFSFYEPVLDAASSESVLIDKMTPGSVSSRSLSSDDISSALSMDFSPVVDLSTEDKKSLTAVRNGVKTWSMSDIEADLYSDQPTGVVYDTGEPRLFFMTNDGRVFDDYGSALKTGTKEIQIGFISRIPSNTVINAGDKLISSAELIPVVTANTSTNITSRHGLINYLIKKGYLSGSKVYDPDTRTYYLAGAGAQGGFRLFNSAQAYYQLANVLGSSAVEINEKGLIKINNVDRNRVPVLSADNKQSSISRDSIRYDLKAGRYSDLYSKYAYFDKVLVSIILEDNSIYRDINKSIVSSMKENDLKHRSAVLDILKTLGVRVVGMSDYLEKYKTKYGHEPSAKALADIANSVIAVAENATVNDLIEEAAHFMVEAYQDQQSIRDILPDIESTEEWSAYAKDYYDVYSKTLEGDTLDEAVRREVLGKIISNRFTEAVNDTTSATSTELAEPGSTASLWARTASLIRGIITSLSGSLTNQKTELNKIINDITDAAISNNPNVFDTNLLKDNTFTLYSLSAKEQNKFLQSRLTDLRRMFKSLRQVSANRTIVEQNKSEGESRNVGANVEVTASSALNRLSSIEKRLNQADNEITKGEMIASLNSLISTVEAQINYVKNVIGTAYNNSEDDSKLHIDSADRQNLDIINRQAVPLLNELRGFIKHNSDYSHTEIESYVKRIDKAVSDINGIKSDIDTVMDTDKLTFMTKILDKFSIPKAESVRNKIYEEFDAVQKDVSVISRWFGTLENSGSIINRSLGRLIADNNYNALVKTQNDINKFLSQAQKGGWKVSDYEKILQKINGKDSIYLRSGIDMARYDRDLKIAQMKAFRDVIDEMDITDEQIEDIVDTDSDYLIESSGARIKPSADRVNTDILSVEQEKVFSDKMRSWFNENTEQRYKTSFDSKVKSIHEEAERTLDRKLTQDSIEFLSNLSRQRYILKSPFYREDGTFDTVAWRKSSNYAESLLLRKQKKEMASEYIYTGTDSIRIKKEGIDLSISEDINAIDQAWKTLGEDKSGAAISKEFYDAVEKIQKEQGAEDALTFIMQSGYLSFSEKYWADMGNKSIGSTQSNNNLSYMILANAVRSLASNPEVLSDVDAAVKAIEESKAIIREIISFNRDVSNPGEINYESLTKGETDSIRICSERIERNYMDLLDTAKEYMDDIDKYLVRPDISENVPNKAYLNAFVDSGLKEYEFCMNHTTSRKADKIHDFAAKIKQGLYNRRVFSVSESEFLADYFNMEIDFSKTSKREFRSNIASMIAEAKESNPNIENSILGAYSRRFVFSYFKRMAPVGYTELLGEAKNGRLNLLEMVRDLENGTKTQDYPINLDYLKLEIDNQWKEESDAEIANKNPNYKQNHGYGRYMPALDKYRDNSYYSDYGIITDEDGNEQATKNTKEWNMIQSLKDLKKKAVETYGEKGRNIYSIPQISKTGLEKTVQLGTDPASSVRNYLADIALDRVDDSLYGRTNNDDSIDLIDRPRIIPKYFLNSLEKQNDVSHDLSYSYTMLMLQSNLYNEKNKTLENVMGLQQHLINSQFNNGKKPEATHSYAMFKDFMDDHYFGIRVNTKRMTADIAGYKIDITKLMMGAERFMSTMNLALSPFVAATGAVTGHTNLLIESAVGQYIDRDSIGYAQKELSRMAGSYIDEIGDIDRKSKLYTIGERLGIFNIRNRVYGSGFNKTARVLTRDPMYKFMEILNSPLDPEVMIASLDNTRYYKGGFVSFNEFKAIKESENDSFGIRDKWTDLRPNSLWNAIDVVDGAIVAKNESNIPIRDIESQLLISRNKIKSLTQITNGTLNEENRVGATRNWMLRFTTAHRGWLTIAAQRLWKRKGYNFQTMQMEEGLCITVKNMMRDIFKLTRENNISDISKAWAEYKSGMTEEEQINVRRLGVYASTFLIMQAVTAALYGWRDDDDETNNWTAQFITYVGLRTVNEIASQMPLLMESNILDIINDPFVMARKLKDFSNFDNYSLDKVTSGSYKGESKLFRLLAKQTFIKQWYGVKSADVIKRTSDWWNQTNRQSMMFFWGSGKKAEDVSDIESDVNYVFK